jgi:hypothetical protein
MEEISDYQWLVLDLLMRAREKGITSISRLEILNSSSIPKSVSIKLVWSALTMPSNLIVICNHDFSITETGIAIFEQRFKKPTDIADSVICLPGPEHYHQ